MRLWSLHPKYLDAKGLVALWREALLAQKVLLGETKGYRHHPQLQRFQLRSSPHMDIGAYLKEIAGEATRRGYEFDKAKIKNGSGSVRQKITHTRGQVQYEWAHPLSKLKTRDPSRYRVLKPFTKVHQHPLFMIVEGAIEDWERPTLKSVSRAKRKQIRKVLG